MNWRYEARLLREYAWLVFKKWLLIMPWILSAAIVISLVVRAL